MMMKNADGKETKMTNAHATLMKHDGKTDSKQGAAARSGHERGESLGDSQCHDSGEIRQGGE